MERNRTAPSPGPGNDGAIVGASPSPVPPLALNVVDVVPAATQLPTVCKPNSPYTKEAHVIAIVRVHYSLSLKRAESRRADEQTRASMPLPL